MSQQPNNPLLQPPFFLIPGINPSAPISVQTEQIDQLNTLLLQEIDANFAKFHQVVTAKILPEIKRFAIAGEPTREAAQFWRSFYEAAAAVRGTAAGESTVADDTHNHSTYEDETVTLQREGGETLTSAHDEGSFIFGQGVTASTPVRSSKHNGPRDSWEDSIESPYERTDRMLQDMRIGGGASLEDDSSDMPTPSLPAGYSLSAIARDSLDHTSRARSGHHDDGSESSSSRILEPPRPAATATSSSSTPKATRTSTAEQQRLTDLRNTPLNAKFPKPSKGQLSAYKSKYSHLPAGFDFEDSDDDIITGMSPPRTMNFGTLPPRAQAMQAVARDKTPKKGVVADTQSVLDDLLSEMHNHESSPRLESPVLFGGHHSLLPEEMVPESQLGPSASTSQTGSTGGLQLPYQSQGQQNRRSMAANTSYGSDIVTGAPHGQIIGDDSYGNDDSFSSDGSGTVPPPADYRSDVSYMTNTPGLGLANNNNRGDFTTTMGRDGRGELRDTEVFGQPGGASGDHRSGGSGSGRPFELMKMDEMYTFHGGRLEDAAGREVDDTPVKARAKRDP